MVVVPLTVRLPDKVRLLNPTFEFNNKKIPKKIMKEIYDKAEDLTYHHNWQQGDLIMINNKKIIVVLPAFNAGKTLEKTLIQIPLEIVDDIILVDDYSSDNTIEIAEKYGLEHIFKHTSNLGYGANQKTCYEKIYL